MINIYVGNLPWRASEETLRAVFEPYGDVSSAKIVSDRETGRSRGFAFVEMPDKASGLAAIEALNDKEFEGRNLRVNEARPREDRPRDDRPRGPRGRF